MGNFAIMNNGPGHFIASGIGLLIFIAALLTSDRTRKKQLRMALMIVFALQIVSGLFVWTVVASIGWAIIVKSLGGLVLMWLFIQLIDDPSNRLYWILAVLIAIVGLSLAFFYI